MPSLRILQRPNRGGKTYEGLKWLHERGGGVFVTQYSADTVQPMIDHFNFQNIEVISTGAYGKPVVIDDADAMETMITTTFPASLSWKAL